ncbi:hypothetical protein ACFLY6_01870 [Candidatus Dependentiae bacterium]
MRKVLSLVCCTVCLFVSSGVLCDTKTSDESAKNKLLESVHIKVLFKSYETIADRIFKNWVKFVVEEQEKLSQEAQKEIKEKFVGLIDSMRVGIKDNLDPVLGALKDATKEESVVNNVKFAALFKHLVESAEERIQLFRFESLRDIPEIKPFGDKIFLRLCNDIFDGIIEFLKDENNRKAVTAILLEDSKKN